jgi:hypothetical protein
MPESTQSLSQFLEGLANEMKGIMDARGMNASGRSKGLIEARVSGTHGELLAPNWILQLEQGRGPTRGGRGKGPTLREIIRRWIDDKGVIARNITKDQLAFAITKSIHEHGTKLFQSGGSSGIISTVITQQRIDAFLTTFAKEELDKQSAEVNVLFKELLK